MQIMTPEDVQPDVMAKIVAEVVRGKFGAMVEIEHTSANELWVSSKGFAAEVRVGEPVEIIGHFPVDDVCQIPLCDPKSFDRIVERLRKWMPGR